jgi:hypothetical protein
MYSTVKAVVRYNERVSHLLKWNIGAKKRDILAPVSYLDEIKLFILVFADDFVGIKR